MPSGAERGQDVPGPGFLLRKVASSALRGATSSTGPWSTTLPPLTTSTSSKKSSNCGRWMEAMMQASRRAASSPLINAASVAGSSAEVGSSSSSTCSGPQPAGRGRWRCAAAGRPRNCRHARTPGCRYRSAFAPGIRLPAQLQRGLHRHGGQLTLRIDACAGLRFGVWFCVQFGLRSGLRSGRQLRLPRARRRAVARIVGNREQQVLPDRAAEEVGVLRQQRRDRLQESGHAGGIDGAGPASINDSWPDCGTGTAPPAT